MAVDKHHLDSATPASSHDISRVVRLLMRLADKSQDDVGEAIGVGKSQVSARLNGHTDWKADDVARVAQLFGVQVGLLFLPIEQIDPHVLAQITRLKSAITGKEAGQHLAVVASNAKATGKRHGPPLVRGVPTSVAD